jgi:hypothetical protein
MQESLTSWRKYVDALLWLLKARIDRVPAGPPGPPGPAGPPGALATVAAPGFVQPAVEATVSIPVTTSGPLNAPGNFLAIASGGLANNYKVISVPDATHVVAQNLGGSNAAAGTAMAAALPAVPVGPADMVGAARWFDVREYGATAADVGLGVLSAILALKANGGGSVYIPPSLATSQVWTSSVQVIGGAVPPSLDIQGASTRIQCELVAPVFGNPLLYLVSQDDVVIRDLVFVGDLLRPQDVPQLLRVTGGKNVTIKNIVTFNLGAGGQGLIQLGANFGTVTGCRFYGSADNGDGVITSSCSQTLIVDCYFATSGARGQTTSWIEFTSGQLHGIEDCSFDQSINIAAIWVNGASGIVNVHRCTITTGPALGIWDVLVQSALIGLDVSDTQFLNLGGHVGPEPVISLQAQCQWTRVDKCSLFSSLVDKTTWPKFQIQATVPTGGTLEVTDLGNNKLSLSGPFTTWPTGTTMLYDFSLGVPSQVVETYDGQTTLAPQSIPNLVHYWDALNQVQLNPGAIVVGAAATYAPVVAGHNLQVEMSVTAPVVIIFSGAENSQATFFAAITAQSGGHLTPSNSAGQTRLTAAIGYNRSFGSVLAASSADVLASLGLVAGDFPTLPRIVGLGDNSGHGLDPQNNLVGGANYLEVDPSFNNWPSLQFRGTDLLATPIGGFTAPIPQPYTVFLVARQRTAATVYAFDGRAADSCAIRGVAAENAIQVNAGVNAIIPVADTTKPTIYIVQLNGAASKIWISSNTATPFVTGGNALLGATLGQIGGGGAVAGWDVDACGIYSGPLTLQQTATLNAYLSRRFGIALQ